MSSPPPAPSTTSAVLEAIDKKKRVASAASQWGFYLMFFAMTTSDLLRAPSGALRPYADGLGTGFSGFNYGGNGAAMESLIARSSLASQFGHGADAEDDDDNNDNNDDVDAGASQQDDHSEGDSGSQHRYGAGDSYGDEESFDEAAIEIEDDDGMTIEHAAAGPSSALATHDVEIRTSFSDFSVNVLETILEFLPVRDVNRVRHMSLGLGVAAARLCPQPLGHGITFVRCTHLASLPKPVPNPHAPPVPFYWRCASCNQYSDNHEVCVCCGTSIRQSGCRVFLGQVRKQHAAVALSFLLRAVAPEVDVLHIESHSNRDGYEKGAAWVYVDTPEQALAVTALHKRVLFDCDGDGHEGFWLLDDQRLEAQFADFAASRKSDASRRERPLPGQPLVAEFPQSSMLRGYKPAPLYKEAAAGTLLRNHNGWFRHAPYPGPAPAAQ
uniref:F-box domain-containing protein n=1 Tax=Neobodo designis TaxID=312471 RepID=A0A7S1W1V7_NEODS|mmetsp:Transcript_49555/g.152968  ORF Transcript_49555/g.152968 Transcript_49555/m.152968 type:complete len:440 (+) Transcript_49555:110-1429(+)|eukprot:CAMPEP_0174856376 /NCGR_PEP_ID=MMETSP1114-20130205/35768_1 /TAXON_ID=312471 /ORGANISM="Neobodo designis, Strain CCAP 1951/1" /LENGTH=439 /DNA_ID=CAMNT_0016091171 /DNA_START=108 /DNA_END=1427 /DNA_ORIENTATION=+